MQVQRNLIAKEIELGFLRVPSKIKSSFPKNNTKIKIIIGSRKRELSYNPKYQRIFGLTDFYRKNKAEPKDLVLISVLDNGEFKLEFSKSTPEEKALGTFDAEEAKEIIDVSELPSQTKGNIVEQRIGELILLYGQGLLNVYKPISDIEGIDLIVIKKGVFLPVFIQVKSRYNLRSGGSLQIGLKQKNFTPHHSFFIVGAYFNPQKMDLDDHLLFINSNDFQKQAARINDGKDNGLYVITTKLTAEYEGKYSDFIIKKENLVNKIFEKFQEGEKYLK